MPAREVHRPHKRPLRQGRRMSLLKQNRRPMFCRFRTVKAEGPQARPASTVDLRELNDGPVLKMHFC